MGTGDGRYPLFVARTRSYTFAIGIDPSLDALRRTSRALVRRPLANVALIISAVEAARLGPLGDLVTVHFPWGSLLAAVLGDAPSGLASLASLVKPGANVRVLVSATERDGHAPLGPEARAVLAQAYAAAGLRLCTMRPASRAEVEAARSSWGKRLDAGGTRPAYLLTAHRR